jgi:hypothetical protein
MKELIEALQIFLKYGDIPHPTGCEHDELSVYVNPETVSKEDIKKLDELGFTADHEYERFYSFKYGSA